MKKIQIIALSAIFAICMGLGVACSRSEPKSKFPNETPEETQIMNLEFASKELAVDETFELRVFGTNGIAPSFSTDNEDVISVNQTGRVVALSIGEATITVTAGEQTKNCYVTVVAEKSIPLLKVNNVIYKDGRYSLPIGISDEYALDVSLYFKGAPVSGQIYYRSTDENVATVDNNGIVRAVGTGNATIELYGEYKGQYQQATHTEIAVTVSNFFWNFSRADEDTLYSLPEFNGKIYKNSVEFDAKLTLDNVEYDLDQLTVTAEDDIIQVSGNLITAKKAGTTNLEISYTDGGDTYKIWREFTVNAIDVDLREDDAYSMFVEKRAVESGDQILTLPLDPETEEFKLIIGDVDLEIKGYDSATREATIEGSQLLALGDKLSLEGSIENGTLIYHFKVNCVDYVLETAEDFERYFNTEFFDNTANGGSKYEYYSFKIANDIDLGGVILNNSMNNGSNAYTGTIDGNGHVVKNLTFNPNQYESYGGLINYRAGYGAVVKDIALVNMSTPRAFITNKADGLVLKNVYISGTCGGGDWAKVFDEAHSTISNVIIENVIINSDVELFDKKWFDNVTVINVINLGKYRGGVPRFFADYADGLGEEWADSGFAITDEGLTFHGTLILEKVLPAPATSLTSESDLNAKFLKNDNDSYELTSDIICETKTSITYKSWIKFKGILDGNGHIVKNAIIDDDITSFGILGQESIVGTVKDIAFVNVTNSYRGYLAETAEDLLVENAYFSGTFGIKSGWNDLIQNAKGNVVFKNVIIDCYGVDNGGYAAGKAGTGAENVTYENVITLDKNGKGAREGSDYGGTLMTYEEFFTTFADGLGEEWADSGFAITAEGLTFHGTLILERP